jgi:hypothetical protein
MAGIEHMGPGLAAKQFAPLVPLWILMISAEVLDIIWGICYLTGIENMGFAPWSHGLFMSIVWSILFGIIGFLFFKDKRSGIAIGLLVFSHWVVDFITHPMGLIIGPDAKPDLPIFFSDTPKVGLGLYNTLPGVIIGMTLLIVPGLVMYILYRKKIKNN